VAQAMFASCGRQALRWPCSIPAFNWPASRLRAAAIQFRKCLFGSDFDELSRVEPEVEDSRVT
jgi:hypothetical protein